MAKKIKLRDKTGEQLIPVTRSTTVEMNDGVNLQTAYEGINSTHYTKAEINEMGYLQNYTEHDPTVPSYVKGITQTDITNWNSSQKSKYIFTIESGGSTAVTSETYQSLAAKITNGEIPEAHEIVLGAPTSAGDIFYLSAYNFSGEDFISFVNAKADYMLTFYEGNAAPILTQTNYITQQKLSSNSYVTQTSLSANGYLTSFTETDPIYSASAAAVITSTDITNWNSKTDNVGTITGITMNGASKGASGVVDLGTVLTEHQSLSSYVTSGYYDTTTHKIYLRHGTNVLSEIDANDFIKDGMVDTAYVQGSYLVISFNTDAGKQPVEVPIADIFNPTNYYTKTEINNASYVQYDNDYLNHDNVKLIGTNGLHISNASSGLYHTVGISFETNYALYGDNYGFHISDYINGVGEDTDYKFPKNRDGIVALTKDITNAINTYVVSASYLTSFTETDPIYSASAAAGITSGMITNWNSYANVKANWNETDSNSAAYIQNKPTIPNGLPTVSSTDNGKVLQVVNGIWTLVTPLNLYSGTGTPNNAQGNNGDLYMQI